MAIACLRLFTVPPLPALPERRVPFFSRRIALATDLLAAAPYLRLDFLGECDFFLLAMRFSCILEGEVWRGVARVLQRRLNAEEVLREARLPALCVLEPSTLPARPVPSRLVVDLGIARVAELADAPDLGSGG